MIEKETIYVLNTDFEIINIFKNLNEYNKHYDLKCNKYILNTFEFEYDSSLSNPKEVNPENGQYLITYNYIKKHKEFYNEYSREAKAFEVIDNYLNYKKREKTIDKLI